MFDDAFVCKTLIMLINTPLELLICFRSEYTQEDQNRGKPNWEHLSDDLHVLLTVEDTENRAQIKLARAVEEVKKLLVPVRESFIICLTVFFIISSRCVHYSFDLPMQI